MGSVGLVGWVPWWVTIGAWTVVAAYVGATRRKVGLGAGLRRWGAALIAAWGFALGLGAMVVVLHFLATLGVLAMAWLVALTGVVLALVRARRSHTEVAVSVGFLAALGLLTLTGWQLKSVGAELALTAKASSYVGDVDLGGADQCDPEDVSIALIGHPRLGVSSADDQCLGGAMWVWGDEYSWPGGGPVDPRGKYFWGPLYAPGLQLGEVYRTYPGGSEIQYCRSSRADWFWCRIW